MNNNSLEITFFIDYEFIAALAWKGFIKKGRGAVICNKKMGEKIPNIVEPNEIETYYCPFIYVQANEFAWSEKIFIAMNTYDPKQDIILIIIDSQNDISHAYCYQITNHETTPEQAYQKKSMIFGEVPIERLN